MTAPARARPRVLVCGAIFGQVYIEAFSGPDAPFELAGILSRGSARSRSCAERHGVPLYTALDELPGDIDLACVVVRSALLGGTGTELARALMARGIHVLQEHPLHHDELAACLRDARRHDVAYHLNSFYPHLAPVRRFIAAARTLLGRHPPRFVEAASGFQVAYALFDILAHVLGGMRPWQLTAAPAVAGAPFRTLEGTFAGVPFALRLHHELDPADADNHAHLLHRITLGTDAGHLTLVDSHGPTLWTARPRFPLDVRDREGRAHFDGDAAIEPPVVRELAPAPDVGYRQAFATLWPDAVRRAIAQLHADAAAPAAAVARGQVHLALCKLWQDASAHLGAPVLVVAEEAAPLTDGELAAMREAIATS